MSLHFLPLEILSSAAKHADQTRDSINRRRRSAMPEKFKELIREYRDGKITRRQFMRKAATITGSLVIADNLFEKLTLSPAHAAEVDVNDPAVSSREVE
ncbi:MAG: twin-arginine translocation signal domain-containing protein [Deltaproteobacteria bacterium]|nr:MAG: twin-arginine translocation signal domain-containing protein [Deltaproteobacteria bacterium]